MEIVSRRDGRVVDSSGLENRHSFQKLSRVRIPLSPFACEMFLYFFGITLFHKEERLG